MYFPPHANTVTVVTTTTTVNIPTPSTTDASPKSRSSRSRSRWASASQASNSYRSLANHALAHMSRACCPINCMSTVGCTSHSCWPQLRSWQCVRCGRTTRHAVRNTHLNFPSIPRCHSNHRLCHHPCEVTHCGWQRNYGLSRTHHSPYMRSSMSQCFGRICGFLGFRLRITYFSYRVTQSYNIGVN